MSMFRLTVAATLAALALLGTSGAHAAGCVGLEVSSEQKNGGKFDTVFSASSVVDIDLWVLFTPGSVQRFADDHAVEVRFFTPGGYLYQSVVIPFSSDAARKAPRRVEGYPHAIPVRPMKSLATNKGAQIGVNVRLPVGGTNIVASSLYGQWTAEAFVDGEALPCARPATFVIAE